MECYKQIRKAKHIITGSCVEFCIILIHVFIYFIVEDGTAEAINREKGQLVNRNCECCFNCCGGRLMVAWLWIQQVCFAIISEPMFDLFIIICIVLNTMFMTAEHYPQSDTFELTLTVANYVRFTFQTSCVEICHKIVLDFDSFFGITSKWLT